VGWTATDHHGVPWPSSLALLRRGRLQTGAFAGTGTALIGLAVLSLLNSVLARTVNLAPVARR
jgi:hypothetical protein